MLPLESSAMPYGFRQAGVVSADGGAGDLVELPGAASQRRIDKHLGGEDVRHIDLVAGIQRDAVWEAQAGAAPADGGEGGVVERPGAASQRRIDKHARGFVVRHIDVAAGIQRDAARAEQVGLAPADGGDGSLVEQPGAAAQRRIDKHARRDVVSRVTLIRHIDVGRWNPARCRLGRPGRWCSR